MDRKFAKVCLCLGLAVTLCATVLTGCGNSGDAVPVQTVASITGHGNVGYVNRFAGVVVAGNTSDIYLQAGMNVDKMNVEMGDEVRAGDVLFTYDTDYMELMITQAELEIEGLKNTIETAKTQITELQNNLVYANDANKVTYTLEIQSLEMQIKENEYNIGMKQAALDRQKEALRDTSVKSAVNGTVTAVNAKDATDNYGNPLPFIVITESGNMRVKATVNELNIGQVYPGAYVTILSRTDADAVWYGTVNDVDYDNPESSNDNMYYYGGVSDSYTSSSKYPFYVVLENVDGLMMGQHVYIQMGMNDTSANAIWLPAYYVNNADSSPWVWAANSRDKLEKRKITIGNYNPDMDEYEILSGLGYDDAITADAEGLKEGRAVTIYDGSDYLVGDMGMDGYFEDDWGYTDEGFNYEDEGLAFPEEGSEASFEEYFVDEFGNGEIVEDIPVIADAPAAQGAPNTQDAASVQNAPAVQDAPAQASGAGAATSSNIDNNASGSDIGG